MKKRLRDADAGVMTTAHLLMLGISLTLTAWAHVLIVELDG